MHWVILTLLVFDLTSIKTEPNLEKRSDLALKNADLAVTTAREAYNAGEDDKVKAALAEIQESVDLSFQSLSGAKNPRGSKGYKSAELLTRQLMRRMDSFRDSVSLVDQPPIESVRAYIADVHEMLLNAIMGKKKK